MCVYVSKKWQELAMCNCRSCSVFHRCQQAACSNNFVVFFIKRVVLWLVASRWQQTRTLSLWTIVIHNWFDFDELSTELRRLTVVFFRVMLRLRFRCSYIIGLHDSSVDRISAPTKWWKKTYHRLRGSTSPVLTATRHSYGSLAWLSPPQSYLEVRPPN